MNKTEIIQAARRRTDDTVVPLFFDDATYTRWANNAVTEACLRTKTYRDDSTSSVCTVSLAAGAPVVTLDSSIVQVRRAIITDGTHRHPLELYTFNEIDEIETRWDNDQDGEPLVAVMDMTTQTMRFYPVPERIYSMNLLVWRMPIPSEELKDGADEPLLPLWMHKELELWIAYEFFQQHDVDVDAPEKASMEIAAFTDRMGARPAAPGLVSGARNRRRRAYPHFM